MSTQIIEHIVLFKVKDDADPSKISAMLTHLNNLISLDQVLHLTTGPVLQCRSAGFNFTHILHSRYNSKQDLATYMTHPDHLTLVKNSMIPLCDSVLIVDWIANDLRGSMAPPPGSVMRVSLFKPKEDVADQAKSEILGVIGGIKDQFDSASASIDLTYGENFSPERSKGFSIASLAVLPGVKEMEAVDSMEKLKDYVGSAVVVDYVIP